MKKTKIILLTFVLVFLSACSIDYELLITDNHQFIENVDIKVARDFFPANDNVASKRIEEIIDDFRRQEPAYNNYYVDYHIDSEYIFVTIKRDYNSFRHFRVSPLFQNAYRRVIVEEEEFYSLTFNELILYEREEKLNRPHDWQYGLQVTIRSHNTVHETNANKEDYFTNSFVWYFAYDEEPRDIEIIMEYSSRYDVIVWDFLREYYLAILVIVVILGGGGFAYFYYLAANRMRNEI